MPSGTSTRIEKYIRKITYPSGFVTYRIEEGQFGLNESATSLTEARKIKADHLAAHPELIPSTPETRRLKSIDRSAKTKIPGTKFIEEYKTRPGTYSVRIVRRKYGGDKINLSKTVTGLTAAKEAEKKMIVKMEKLIGRGIDELEPRPSNPKYAEALVDVKTQMTKYNKLGYFPRDLLKEISSKHSLPLQGGGANRQLAKLVEKAGLIDRKKLQELDPKFMKAVEAYKNYTGDKTKVGVKKAILDKVGLPHTTGLKKILQRLGIHVKEIIKLPKKTTKERAITEQLRKVSALNIEDFLSGKKLGPLQVTGKTGSLISKMHLAEKKGLITVGEMGYGSSKLNEMLGTNWTGTVGPERHRTALNRHIDRIIKKHKGNPNAMYTIGKGPDSFDQRKFKDALQKVFGKTQGKIPLAKYLDQIINTEVQLMGYATDGLITTRRIDPVTLERMIPPSNLSGARTLTPVGKIKDLTTLQELGLEKQQAGPKRVTPRLRDFNVSATLAFEDAKINIAEFKNRINPYQMKAVVRSIDKMLGEGLQNQAYENISTLSKQCRLLRAKGGRVDFAQGGPCVAAKRAIQNLDNSEFIKIGSKIEEGATGVLGKIKNVSTRFLGMLGRGGVKAAPYAAIAAAGAAIEPLVKQFKIDDPTTYLTDESQMKGMLLATLEGEPPKVDEEILKWQYPGMAASAAAAIPGSSAMMKARRAKGFGTPRAALGPVGKFLAGSFSPLGVAATLPLHIAAQRKGGTDWGDIATDPMNWMAPAFASSGAKMATRGMAPTGILAKAIRMGMKPSTLRFISSKLGMPGLALTAGMWGYDKWKKARDD